MKAHMSAFFCKMRVKKIILPKENKLIRFKKKLIYQNENQSQVYFEPLFSGFYGSKRMS